DLTCVARVCSYVSTVCNDNRVCSTDSCNPATGLCQFNTAACCATNAGCSDGTACTTDTCQSNETCGHTDRGICCLSSAALTRSAVASSSDENTGVAASYAIDGNTSSRWGSTFADEQWLRIDLGATRYVKRVVLRWEAAAASAYDLDVSSSTSGPWTRLYTKTGGTGGVEDIAVAQGLVPA